MYPHILHICCTSTAIVSSPALLQVQLGQLDDVNAFAADAASCPSAACSVRTQLANYVLHQQKLFGASIPTRAPLTGGSRTGARARRAKAHVLARVVQRARRANAFLSPC